MNKDDLALLRFLAEQGGEHVQITEEHIIIGSASRHGDTHYPKSQEGLDDAIDRFILKIDIAKATHDTH